MNTYIYVCISLRLLRGCIIVSLYEMTHTEILQLPCRLSAAKTAQTAIMRRKPKNAILNIHSLNSDEMQSTFLEHFSHHACLQSIEWPPLHFLFSLLHLPDYLCTRIMKCEFRLQHSYSSISFIIEQTNRVLVLSQFH